MAEARFDSLYIGKIEDNYLKLTSTAIEAFDKNGTQRFRVLMEGGVYPTLELCDGNGVARLIATVQQDGAPMLTFRDGNFTTRAELVMDVDDGDVSFILCDRNDNRIFDLSEDHNHMVQMERMDEHGNKETWVPTPQKRGA